MHMLIVPSPIPEDALGSMLLRSLPTFASPLNLLAAAAASMTDLDTETRMEAAPRNTQNPSTALQYHTNQYNPAVTLPPKLVKRILGLEFA